MRGFRYIFCLTTLALLLPMAGGCGGDSPTGRDGGSDAGGGDDAGDVRPWLTGEHRPSVLLVTIDTLRADRVGAYSPTDRRIFTPTLDGLAARGIRYNRAYTTTPLTLPAHASIFTGHAPPGHGVRDNVGYRLPFEADTLPEAMRRAGYETAAFVSAESVRRGLGLEQGFATYNDQLGGAAAPGLTLHERNGRDTIDAARAWLDRHLRQATQSGSWRPIFLWIHLFDPHYPYAPPEDRRSADARAASQASRPEGYAEMPRDQKDWVRATAEYDAEVTWADHQLGRLLDRFAAAELLDQTTVVATADHGESLDDAVEATHGFFLADSTIHVPLIIAGPATTTGRVVDTPVSTASIARTVATIAGLDPTSHNAFGPYHPLPGFGEDVASPAPYAESFFGTLAFRFAPIRGIATPTGFVARSGTHTYLVAGNQWSLLGEEAAADADRAIATTLDAVRFDVRGEVVRHPRLAAGGLDPGAYPGVGLEAGAAPEQQDATWGTTYPSQRFIDRLDGHASAGPDPMAAGTGDVIRRYQRAQRLIAAAKYALADQVLAETTEPYAPLLLLQTESARGQAEERLTAARARSESPVLTAAERDPIVADYRRAAEAYERYVELLAGEAITRADLRAELQSRLGIRWFLAGEYRRTIGLLQPIEADTAPPLAVAALALSWHYLGHTDLARRYLATKPSPPAWIGRLAQRLAEPDVPSEPAILNAEFDLP